MIIKVTNKIMVETVTDSTMGKIVELYIEEPDEQTDTFVRLLTNEGKRISPKNHKTTILHLSKSSAKKLAKVLTQLN